MSSYQGSTSVKADPKAIFDFVSNPENLSKYVPFLCHADLGHGDCIHIKGECPHGAYRGVGGFHPEPDNLRMRWDSRANLNYRGWLQVTDHGDHADVIIDLEFDPGLDQQANKEFIHVLKEHPKTIHEALQETLARIKALCEGVEQPLPVEAG